MSIMMEPPRQVMGPLKELLQTMAVPGGVPGSPENLLRVLETIPQYTAGDVRYLVAGGWAVELLTRISREHHDLDFLILERGIDIIGTDCLTPENYAGAFIATQEEVRWHHVKYVLWNYGQMTVYVPSPEFLVASKLASPMRQKDINDVNALRETFYLNAKLYQSLTGKTLK